MTVTEFLGIVRRIVVDFVVGRALLHGQNEQAYGDYLIDDVTTYYLLHRHDFGFKEAPAGSCILYAISCNLSERELINQYDVLTKSGNASKSNEDSDLDEDEESLENSGDSGGGKFKLKKWNSRKRSTLGMETASGRVIPLIDQVHKLMQLWIAGDVIKVNEYLELRGLRHNRMFVQIIQALIEQSRAGDSADERSILERLQNHLKSLGNVAQTVLQLQ
jgi:hypothetical protein